MSDTDTASTEPSAWDLMSTDPSIPMDRAALRLVIEDQRRASRTYVYPWLRVASRIAVTCIVAGKRLLPVQFRAHTTMDRLCLLFLRRFVAADAVRLLIRHFIIETDLLNFAVRNAQVPGLREIALRPTALSGLGNRAVIEHDLNVYRVLLGIGRGGSGGPVRREPADLDYSMPDVPETDPEPAVRRLLNLDIQTALCLMNIPFALCLTSSEYRRAVHSLRLDTSLLSVLATLTGDPAFLGWRNGVQPLRVDSNIDVPSAVYEHAVLCEYAHARLRALGHAANVGDSSSLTVLPTADSDRRSRRVPWRAA